MSLSRRPRQDLARPSLLRQLPVHSSDILEGQRPRRAVELEVAYGNGDLIRVLDTLGIAGPLRVVSPWELEDERGRHLINAGGYAARPFGEMYPPLVSFLSEYLEKSGSVGLPQQSASDWRAALETNLIALLAAQAPSHADSQVFFSNSGAEAIEAALKFVKAARPQGKYLINFTSAYHGKTFGALSLTPNEEYQGPFRPLMPGVRTVPYGDVSALEEAVYGLGPKNITALVLEPIQGEAGVIIPPEDFLPAVARLAKRYGILTVADEIQSGLGRSGYWFASLAGGLEPDVVTLAKPLGGGLVPVGATIARRWIVKRLLGGLASKRHSNTFVGGSLAMAVGLRSLEFLVEEGLVEKARRDGQHGLERLREIQARYPNFLAEVRGAGMLFALQLQPVLAPGLLPVSAELLQQLGSALALRTLHLGGIHACYTLNSSRVVRLTPALNMPANVFDELFERLERVARRHRRAWRMLPRMPLGRLLRLAKLAL